MSGKPLKVVKFYKILISGEIGNFEKMGEKPLKLVTLTNEYKKKTVKFEKVAEKVIKFSKIGRKIQLIFKK